MDSGDGGSAEVSRLRKVEALQVATKRAVRDVEDALAHYSLDGDNMHASLGALRELIDTDKVLFYSLEQRPGSDDLRVARAATAHVQGTGWRESFDDFLAGRGTAWGPYDALSPQPDQRDRVLDRAQISALTHGRNHAVEEVVLKRLGALGDDVMRVLVCDGPSLLGCVGVVQAQRFTPRQRELFELVVPAFRKRLKFERLVSEAGIARGSLSAALEHVSGPAWLFGPGGRLEHANAAARSQLDADRTATLATLDRCIAGTAEPRFTVTPVRSDRGGVAHVIVETVARTSREGVPKAAIRLGLTPAQTRVLERVARGSSNATIAADLKVAERTVEAHVTAILEKAHVPSRAALIVQIFA